AMHARHGCEDPVVCDFAPIMDDRLRRCRFVNHEHLVLTGSLHLPTLIMEAVDLGVVGAREGFLALARTMRAQCPRTRSRCWPVGRPERPPSRFGRWPGQKLELALLQHESNEIRGFALRHLRTFLGEATAPPRAPQAEVYPPALTHTHSGCR